MKKEKRTCGDDKKFMKKENIMSTLLRLGWLVVN